MNRKLIVLIATVAVLTLGDLPKANLAQAGIFDMMNPSRWFGDNDRDYYYGRRGGYGPGYYGGWGGPWGYPGGWGGPWGYPGGWGYPGYYGYGHPYIVAPSSGTSQQSAPKLPE